MTDHKPTIGFIGLGIMGAPMAGHLIDGGHKVITRVHKTPVPEGLKAKGVEEKPSLKAVAEEADVIIMIVPDTPQVEAVLFAEDGIAAGLSAGKLVIDMSSISPIDTKAFAEKVAAKGCDYVDAPVSGGQVGAEAASLTIMVGATDGGFARAKPLFELMGKNITHVGPIGAGQTTKVANQIIVALNIEAVAEALVFAAKAGADPARVRDALMGGFASSKLPFLSLFLVNLLLALLCFVLVPHSFFSLPTVSTVRTQLGVTEPCYSVRIYIFIVLILMYY